MNQVSPPPLKKLFFRREKDVCKARTYDTVPEETACIARAAYPKGNIYLQLRDAFGSIYEDEHFVEVYPRCGQPADARGKKWCEYENWT